LFFLNSCSLFSSFLFFSQSLSFSDSGSLLSLYQSFGFLSSFSFEPLFFFLSPSVLFSFDLHFTLLQLLLFFPIFSSFDLFVQFLGVANILIISTTRSIVAARVQKHIIVKVVTPTIVLRISLESSQAQVALHLLACADLAWLHQTRVECLSAVKLSLHDVFRPSVVSS
jgi:hypothetical protein